MRLIDANMLKNKVFSTTFTEQNIWALNLLLSFIDEAPTIGGWISVEDRLPENYENVIVAIDDDSGDSHFRYTERGWYFQEGKFWIVDDERRTDVYAWRRFPEPPKEVSKDA